MHTLPGWAIIEAEEKRKEGLIDLPENAVNAIQQGTIIEISPAYYKDGVKIELALKPGNKVVFKKYHDQDLELESIKYKIVHCDHIMVIL